MSNGRQASPLTSRELTEACTCLRAVASSTTAGLRAANGFTRATIIFGTCVGASSPQTSSACFPDALFHPSLSATRPLDLVRSARFSHICIHEPTTSYAPRRPAKRPRLSQRLPCLHPGILRGMCAAAGL